MPKFIVRWEIEVEAETDYLAAIEGFMGLSNSALNATVFSVEQPGEPVRALDMIELAKEPSYMKKLDEAIRTNERLPAEDEAQQKSFDIMVARLRKWRHYLMELAKQP